MKFQNINYYNINIYQILILFYILFDRNLHNIYKYLLYKPCKINFNFYKNF